MLTPSTNLIMLFPLFNLTGQRQTVSTKIIKGHDDKPKGFGYVEFTTLDGLKEALERTGGQMQGRTVRVSVAEPRESIWDSLRSAHRKNRRAETMLPGELDVSQPSRVDSVVGSVEPRWPSLPTNGDDPVPFLPDRLRRAGPPLPGLILPTGSKAILLDPLPTLSIEIGVLPGAASSPRTLTLLRPLDENPVSAGWASGAVALLRGRKEHSEVHRVVGSGIGPLPEVLSNRVEIDLLPWRRPQTIGGRTVLPVRPHLLPRRISLRPRRLL